MSLGSEQRGLQEAGILQHHGRLVGKHYQQVDVILRVRPLLLVAPDVDDGDHTLLRHHRSRKQGLERSGALSALKAAGLFG